MAPLHGIDEGSSIGHWGTPICIFRSSAGTPVFFHWHLMDVGNVLITGETGAGKTLLTSTLLSATIGRARIFAFDHKRGWEAMIRGNGGRYAILGSGTPSFAPLKALGNNPCDIEFLLDLLRCCIQTGGWRELTAEEDRRLILAVNTVMTFPPEHRSIGEVRAFLGAAREGAGARLERWCAGGELGWVLDADTDLITLDGDLYGFDTTNLLGNKTAAAPAMLYLFYQVRLRLDGTPILLPLDEGWSVLADPTFGPAVGRQLRTIRSKNGAVAFITQSPADAVKSGFAASIIQQCPTQIHGANTRITREDFVTALSRTDEEFDVVSHLPLQRGLFLLCRGRDSQVIELNLAGMSDEIAMLSTREEDHWAVDRAVAEAGDDPEAFLALYHRYRKLKRQEVLAA
jgi:type IV secretion system protein VirB4